MTTTINSLTRRLAKLQDATRAQYAQPDFAVIFYDMDSRDGDQIAVEETRALAPGVKTVFYLPKKERLEGEEYTGPYQAY